MADSALSSLPSVSAVLADARIAPLAEAHPWLTRLVRRAIDEAREGLRGGGGGRKTRERLVAEVVASVLDSHARLLASSTTRVVNCTGVVVHTNLGRSVWPRLAREWAAVAAEQAQDLEYDLDSGTRGHRGRRVEEKFALLSGAEDALIVNNNASAVWLSVRGLAAGGRVLLSRGEVVAIGGSFRMHDIVAETGCRLVEVGTTNRTAPGDYEAELAPGATVLKVHRSNFRLEGFTEEVGIAELAQLCREHGARLIYDAGSGALFRFSGLGLPDEPTLAEDIAAGADLVTCSGDKLLGGCQAGIILGRRDLIAMLRKHPMRRAFRVDKTTLAALDAVATHYLRGEEVDEIPTVQQLAATPRQLETRVRELIDETSGDLPAGWKADIVDGRSSVGGGSYAAVEMPTRLLLWSGPKEELEWCHAQLRLGDPAVVSRMNQEGLALDLRAVTIEELPSLHRALRLVWKNLRDNFARRPDMEEDNRGEDG